jgi:hypothetical protein
MSSLKNLNQILFISFLLRFVFLVIDQYYITLPQGGFDAKVFEEMAYLISTSNYDSGFLYYISKGQNLLALIGSFIYYVFGRHPMMLGMLNVLLGVYMVKLVYRASLLLWKNNDIAKKAAWFTAIFPMLIVHSSLFLREIPVNVFLLLAIISFIKYWEYSINKHLFWFVFYAIVAAIFHNGIIFVLFGFIIVIVLSKNKEIIKKRTVFTTLLAPIIIIGFIYLINISGIAMDKFGGSFETAIEVFEQTEKRQSRGNTAYPDWLSITSISNEYWKFPVRVIAFMISPLFPFLVISPYHLLGLLDSLLYIILLKRIFNTRKLIKRSPGAKGVLIITLMLVFIFSLSVSNVGTAIRHRAKMLPLLIILFVPRNIEYKSLRYKTH